MSTQTLTLYAVRNEQGQWLRAKGFGGYGDTWIEDLARARLFGKIGAARSRVTYFARNYPDFPTLQIVEFEAREIRVYVEAERVGKAKKRHAGEDARRKEDARLHDVRYAKEQLAAAKKRIAELERKTRR